MDALSGLPGLASGSRRDVTLRPDTQTPLPAAQELRVSISPAARAALATADTVPSNAPQPSAGTASEANAGSLEQAAAEELSGVRSNPALDLYLRNAGQADDRPPLSPLRESV